jgi:O-antigen ligase
MNNRSTLAKNRLIQLQYQPAWTAILTLALITTLGIFTGFGSILRFGFPVGAFAVGVFLYRKYPLHYLGFCFWLWFLSPLVRRLIDYHSGFVNPSPVLLAPPLVTLISLHTLLKGLPKANRWGAMPFVLAFAAIFYASLIGAINGSIPALLRSLLDWLPPISLGFYLFANWQNYPQYRQNIKLTFFWGVLVMGVYGVLQFLFAPEWDRFWLISVGDDGLGTSFGRPEPLGLRVWSTMASTGPFATAMMVGLILLFINKDKTALRIPANVFGYLAFLLTVVRTEWVCWLLALLILTSWLKSQAQMRLIVIILAIATLIIPLTTIEPFAGVISSRLESFSNLEEDGSANARLELYSDNFGTALSSFQGGGIGSSIAQPDTLINKNLDSGILDIFLTLGLLGTALYMGGMILIIFQICQFNKFRSDLFLGASRAISLSLCSILVMNPAQLGFKGILLWGFMGITLAAYKYNQHEVKKQFDTK